MSRVRGWSRTMMGVAAAVLVASPVQAQTALRGVYSFDQEVAPPAQVFSPGTGNILAVLNGAQMELFVRLTFSGLLNPVGGAHIHTGGPTVNGPVAIDFNGNGFVSGVTAGSYTRTFDLGLAGTYGGAFLGSFGGDVAAARADFVANFVATTVYANLHSATRPAGEIRANLSAVPEPGTYALLATGLAGLALVARRRRAAPGGATAGR